MVGEIGKPRHPNAGRRKGVLNKKSLLVREVLENHGINLAEQIVVRLPKLSTLEQVKALAQLLPYVYPKLHAVQVSGDIETRSNVRISFENEAKLKAMIDKLQADV